jgi:hypothetical protein
MRDVLSITFPPIEESAVPSSDFQSTSRLLSMSAARFFDAFLLGPPAVRNPPHNAGLALQRPWSTSSSRHSLEIKARPALPFSPLLLEVAFDAVNFPSASHISVVVDGFLASFLLSCVSSFPL